MAGELILIVEDNEKNLKLFRDLLRFKGFRVLEASTAELGLALATEHRPDLILMDIQLPDVDGVTALRRLRADPTTAGARVVALTAFAMKEDRQRFNSAGFDGYLVKPIDPERFVSEVEGFLRDLGSGASAPRAE